MNLQEQISKIQSMMGLNESTIKDLSEIIQKGLNMSLKKKYEHILCKCEVIHPDKRDVLEGQKKYNFYAVYLYFIGGPGTDNYPTMRQVDLEMEEIMNEAWDFVYNYFGIPTDVYHKLIKKCDEKND